jgi:hypothetical protein
VGGRRSTLRSTSPAASLGSRLSSPRRPTSEIHSGLCSIANATKGRGWRSVRFAASNWCVSLSQRHLRSSFLSKATPRHWAWGGGSGTSERTPSKAPQQPIVGRWSLVVGVALASLAALQPNSPAPRQQHSTQHGSRGLMCCCCVFIILY